MQGFNLHGKRLEYRGNRDRYYRNIQAIELLRKLQRENIDPSRLTDAQKLTLAHYSAFGNSENLNRAFSSQYDRVTQHTTQDEQERIKRSSLTAFYTSQDILDAKWSGLAPILRTLPGTLKILEPAFGIGMYVATMPLDIRERAEITAVEFDAISSQIAAYLHPDVQLHGTQRFEETDLPRDYFDLVVSNVPFGATRVFDPHMENRLLTRTVHDYFLARSLQVVRPGGLVAILTSYGTMDKLDSRIREWVAERADLLYAVRLPQGTFSANAGTECGTDLLVFRRYDEGDTIEPKPMWTTTEMGRVHYVTDWRGAGFTTASKLDENEFEIDTSTLPVSAKLRMNYLFATHRDATIGQIAVVAYGDNHFSYVQLPQQGTVAAALALALDIAAFELELEPQRPLVAKAIAIKRTVKPMADRETPLAQRMLGIEVAAQNLVHADRNGLPVAEMNRTKLNDVYDAFVVEFGIIHTPKNLKALKGEPELNFLKALENNVRVVGKTMQATKATLFERAVVQRNTLNPTETIFPDDAVLHVMEELGRFDMPRVMHLTGMTEVELVDALKGQVFRNPSAGKKDEAKYVLADEYLSGDVRKKYIEALDAAQTDPSYQENTDALGKIIPNALTTDEIKVNMGAPWVPIGYYHAFISQLIPQFGRYYSKGIVKYHELLARWVIEDPHYARRTNEATVTWGTGRMHALDIIDCGMNNRPINIRDTFADGSSEPNQKETLLAREKWERIKEAWKNWLWLDEDRAKDLTDRYNVLFNSTVKRTFSGKHLRFPGMNTSILRGGALADYQQDAVWMALQKRATLLDLRVGAGKTFIMLAIVHEAKRLGLIAKPAVTVPNHLVGQWADEANRLYPDMRVLAMSPEDFTKERRGTFLSRIVTEDWDLIILGHSTFGLIEPGEIAREYIDLQIIEYRHYLEDLTIVQAGESTRTKKKSIKDIEKALEGFETTLKEMDAKIKHDDDGVIGWDMLGIDWLGVDEAHEFKNLGIPTSMGSIPGVPKGNSQRAMDMRIKTWDMLRRGQRVVFATGTPVLNTLGEVFIMQKYLQEEVLVAHGINHFDAWARTFAETQTMFEMTPDGGGFRMNTRLSKFVNLPELFNMWFEFVYSKSNEALKLPTPKIISGRPMGYSVPGTLTLKRLVQSFVARVDAIKGGRVDPTIDNMLKVTSDGRKAALDVRLCLGGPEEPVCKINYLVNLVAEVYYKYEAAKATQLIYCELSTPKGRADGTKSKTKAKDGEKSVAALAKDMQLAKQAKERAALNKLVGNEREESPTGEDEEVQTAQEEQDNNFVYHEIRAKLAILGIPAHEVAFIQHHNTRAKRTQLFADMNAGRVRVLICSKQSTGMNIQHRLVAEWNLDAPWRPGDLEQRYGRIERQGNVWPEIYIGNIVTAGSFDGYTWQTLETKARFIQQMRAQDITMREIDDISTVVLTASEIKALASGNPKIMRKVQIEAELMKLDAVSSGYKDAQRRMTDTIRATRAGRAEHKQRKIILGHAKNTVTPLVPKEFKANLVSSAMAYDIIQYTTEVAEGAEPTKPGLIRKAAGEHLQRLRDQLNAQAEMMNQPLDKTVGNYRGLLLRIKAAPKRHFSTGMVYLAVDDEDDVPSPVFEIKGETDEGLFVSADAVLRGLDDAYGACDGRIEMLAEQIRKVETEMAKPWDMAAHYAELQQEYSAVTADLYGEKKEEEETKQVLVVENEVGTVELPMVMLPEPEDVVAMERAMAFLIAEDRALLMLEDAQPTIEIPKQAIHLLSVESREQVGVPSIAESLFTPAEIEEAKEVLEAPVVRVSSFARFVKANEMGKNKHKPVKAPDNVEQAIMF